MIQGVRRFYGAWFLLLEFVLAVVACSAFVVWAVCFDGAARVEEVLQGNRADVYGTLASICGSLFGFTITAVSVVMATSGSPRLQVVRASKHYGDMWQIFLSSIRCLGAATIILIVGLLVDRDEAPRMWVFYMALFTISVVMVRLARVVWVLGRVIQLVNSPSRSRPPIMGA